MLGKRMEAEIREQPDALARNSTRYFEQASSALQGRGFELVLLVARGSSDHAALFARYLVEIHLGIPASLAAPSVLTRYGVRVRYPKCLAIGISQSGAAPDVSEVLGALREAGHTTLGITNTPGSRVASTAEHSIELGVGPEAAVAATKTYTASLLALYQVVRALGGALPDPEGELPDDAWVRQAEREAAASAGYLVRSQIAFALARGYGFATANEAALKLMECALLPCKSYSIADFEHGPKALAVHGSAAVVFGESVPHLAEQGCLTIQAPSPEAKSGIRPELVPIWDAVFAQWLALHAARARALDPDEPPHLEKVTRTL